MSTKNPTFKITGAPESRQQATKTGGTRSVWSQTATFESEQLRMNTDVEIDGPNMAYRVGDTLEWDVASDIVAGQYQRLELSRRKTLRPLSAVAKAA